MTDILSLFSELQTKSFYPCKEEIWTSQQWWTSSRIFIWNCQLLTFSQIHKIRRWQCVDGWNGKKTTGPPRQSSKRKRDKRTIGQQEVDWKCAIYKLEMTTAKKYRRLNICEESVFNGEWEIWHRNPKLNWTNERDIPKA